MFDTIIFDWDGTLANTKKVLINSFKKALLEINRNPSNKLIERLIGIGSAQTFKELLKKEEVHYDEKLIDFLVKYKVEKSIELSKEIKLFKGARELLEILKPRIKLSLASMNKKIFIEHLLKQFKLSDFFKVVITADEIIKAKPNPEIFLKCAKILKIEPNRCIVVEDSIFGVRAAKRAGMFCIAVLTGAYNRSEINAESPDLIINSLTEKQKIMNFIFH
jgi:HAD superfamily hydrolase (TIGR01509 family)